MSFDVQEVYAGMQAIFTICNMSRAAVLYRIYKLEPKAKARVVNLNVIDANVVNSLRNSPIFWTYIGDVILKIYLA